MGTHGVPTLRQSVCCSRHARARAHARACAVNYVLGNADTNVCPAGYYKITKAATCEAAAAAVGKPYGGGFSQAIRPSGCFLDTSTSKVDFNPNAIGAAASTAQPLCLFGAPRARVCVYSVCVLSACARGDVFSSGAVTARALAPAVVRHVCAADYVYGTADTAPKVCMELTALE